MIPSIPKNTHISPNSNSQTSSPVFSLFLLSRKQNMSTTSTVCQGLQSCLEPLLHEPRVLVHQFVPSKQGLSFHKQTEVVENSKNCSFEKIFESNRNDEDSSRTWNFIQSTTNPSFCFRKSNDEAEKVYVHPLAKRSTSLLSTESLEMCTESLGSETGSGIDSSIDEFTCHVLEKQSSCKIEQTKTRELVKKVRHSSSFPPPLTSISGSEGVQVQTHREGGRLVIKAFSFTSSSTYFQAERENGRLRLSLVKDNCMDSDDESVENEEEDERENVDEVDTNWDDSDDEADLKGLSRGENRIDDGGKIGCKIGGGGGGGEWSSNRCNGDRSSRKRIPSLQPFCMAIS